MFLLTLGVTAHHFKDIAAFRAFELINRHDAHPPESGRSVGSIIRVGEGGRRLDNCKPATVVTDSSSHSSYTSDNRLNNVNGRVTAISVDFGHSGLEKVPYR